MGSEKMSLGMGRRPCSKGSRRGWIREIGSLGGNEEEEGEGDWSVGSVMAMEKQREREKERERESVCVCEAQHTALWRWQILSEINNNNQTRRDVLGFPAVRSTVSTLHSFSGISSPKP